MNRYGAAEIAGLLGRPEPTPEQRRVIESPLEPAVVVAGAGAGKTATMAMRVLWLVANHIVEPGEILGLTFTNKAAGELEERIRLWLSQLQSHPDFGHLAPGTFVPMPGLDRPEVATYNSYAASLVREYGAYIGVEPDAALLDQASRFQLAADVIDAADPDVVRRIGGAGSTKIANLLRLADSCAEHLVPPSRLGEFLAGVTSRLAVLPSKLTAAGASPATGPTNDAGRKARDGLDAKLAFVPLIEAFRSAKRDRGVADFGDQLAQAAQIAREVDEVAAERERWKVVLLDEYQDTSYSQVALLSALFGRAHAVTAVGDPRQSIYGWRGASEGNMTEFPERFRRADGRPAAEYSLSIGFRNDHAVLDIANALAAELGPAVTGGADTELRPGPAAGPGRIAIEVYDTDTEEIAALADWARDRLEDGGTSAILCRTRDQVASAEAELRGRGIPVHVMGTDGLLSVAAVADLVALLHVVDDPDSGQHLMRLLTGRRFNLGAADVAALYRYSRSLAAARAGAEEAPIGLVEAIDGARDVPGLSDSGARRVRELAATLARLRGRVRGGITELVRAAEAALNLDIEAHATVHLAVDTARGNLDAFHRVAADFQASGGGLPAFLAWLEIARTEERGLERVVTEPDDGAVALLTVHAAKGLEWDAVAVPGLRTGTFPSSARNVKAWFDTGTFPHPLRGDRDHLVAIDHESRESWTDVQKHLTTEVADAVRTAHLDSERKLAYVALTRARNELRLSHHWFKGGGAKPAEPSPFLATAAGAAGVRLPAEAPESNPQAGLGAAADWPVVEAADTPRRRAADLVWARLDAGGTSEVADDELTRWALRLFREERERAERRVRENALADRLSTTKIVSYQEDADAYLRNQRRPLPAEPSRAAAVGTAFHAWVQNRYEQASIEGWDAIAPGALPDIVPDRLCSNFEASRFAALLPIGVEIPFELTLGRHVVPGKIDAVFDHGDAGIEVVDWKTGRMPPAEELASKELQLAIYRIAYAELAGIDPERVAATFFYLGDDTEYRAGYLPGRAAVEELLDGGETPGGAA